MPRMGSKRVGFSPDINEKPTMTLKSTFDARTKTFSRSRSHNQMHRSFAPSTAKLFRCVKANVTRALRLFSKRRTSAKSSSHQMDQVPQRFVPHRDSHQSEALEDCIEFINSSYRKSI